jgi:hypothetical protein
MRHFSKFAALVPVTVISLLFTFSDSHGLTTKKQKGSAAVSLQIDDKAITKIIDGSYTLITGKLSAELKGPLNELRPTKNELDGKARALHQRYETYEDDALVALIVLLPYLPQERVHEIETKIIGRLTLPESGLRQSSKYSTHLQDLEKRETRYNTQINQTDENSTEMVRALEEKNPEKIYEVYPVLRGIMSLLEAHRNTTERAKRAVARARRIDTITLEKLTGIEEMAEKERPVIMGALEKFKQKENIRKAKQNIQEELDNATARLDVARQNLDVVKNDYAKELTETAEEFKKCRDELHTNMKETMKYMMMLGNLRTGANPRDQNAMKASMNVIRLRISLFNFFSHQKEINNELEHDNRDAEESETRPPSQAIKNLEKTVAGFQRAGKTLGRGIKAMSPDKEETVSGAKSLALGALNVQHGSLKEFRRDFSSWVSFEDRISKSIVAASDVTAEYYDRQNKLQKKLVVPLTELPGRLEKYYKKYLLEYFGKDLYDDKHMIKDRYDKLIRKSETVKKDLQAFTEMQDTSYRTTKELIATTKEERENQAKKHQELMGKLKNLEEEYEAKYSGKKAIKEFREILPMQKNIIERSKQAAELLKNFNESVKTSNNFMNGINREINNNRTGLEERADVLKQDVADYAMEHREFLATTEAALEEKMKNVKTAYKILKLLYGLLPNSDKRMNYLSQIQVQYKKKIYSRITVYNRDYFEGNEEHVTDSNNYLYRNSNTKTIKRTDLHFTALHWDALAFSLPYQAAMIAGVEISLDYFKEEVETFNQRIWLHDDGEQPLLLEKRSEVTHAYLPWLDLNLALNFRSRYTIGFGGGIMPWSYERINTDINYNRIIVKRLGPPVETETISYTVDWTNNFSGWGYRINGSFEILNFLYGDWKFFLGYAVKIGETENTFTFSGALSDESRRHTLQGVRTNLNFNCYYTMNFLDFLGLRPMLRFGMEEQKVFAGGTQYDYLSYRKYDLGIVFRY